jgi:HD-GYP domain-containing protein (c-di-GMP phosphodiesterase class II)
MQRISALYVKPGMELARPVYDNWGDLALPVGATLDARDIAKVDDIGVGELFICNQKTEDINILPLIPPELEGAISKALRRALIECRTMLISRSQQSVDLALINNLMDELIDTLASETRGDASIAGCYSLRDYNFVHPVKVASLSVLLGKASGLSDREVKQLGMASLFQNVGYVLLPQGILEKAGFLNSAEMKAVQRHPVYGSQILARYTEIGPEAVNIVLQHHERWNGSGYPFGLRNNGISQPAGILGIIDVCFALASKRPHREEFLPAFAIEHSIVSSQDAIEYVYAYSGELFDPALVKMFTKIVPIYPAGTMVKLNDGRIGIVSKSNPECVRRPKLRIVGGTLTGENDEHASICTGCELECDERQNGKEPKKDVDLSKEIKKNVLISEMNEF